MRTAGTSLMQAVLKSSIRKIFKITVFPECAKMRANSRRKGVSDPYFYKGGTTFCNLGKSVTNATQQAKNVAPPLR